MKKITYISALMATALFAGASQAGVDNDDDIKYGTGSITASPSTPYVFKQSGPKGIERDIVYGQVELRPSESMPVEGVRNNMDNRDDMIYGS